MLGQPGRPLIGETGGDLALSTKSGPSRMVRWQCTRFAGSDGTTTYAIGVDVTDELEMQRRTSRAQRLAAVGTLAAGLAHEVRNPLNSANLQHQVLKRRLKKQQTEAAIEASDLVASEIQRLDRLVSEFLAFARPRPLRAKAADPADFLRRMFTLLEPEADARGVSLSLEIEEGVQQADLEEERMSQVILNLARNGIEAMQRGGKLVLRARRANHAGSISLEVEDDGPGFANDAPVFDAFYTTKPQGTGLGLAIAHRIVADHGGILSVDSRPGHTCFTVALPSSSHVTP
jgi:signal transduction histidine kinase